MTLLSAPKGADGARDGVLPLVLPLADLYGRGLLPSGTVMGVQAAFAALAANLLSTVCLYECDGRLTAQNCGWFLARIVAAMPPPMRIEFLGAPRGPHFHRNFVQVLILPGEWKRLNTIRGAQACSTRSTSPRSRCSAASRRRWSARSVPSSSPRSPSSARSNEGGGSEYQSWPMHTHECA